jgi:2-(1,2-epoxy-1,2-dihydrophenyl)acetyl-CoA isomerase
MDRTPVIAVLENGVLTLMLNRPQRLNAMSNALIEAMNREIARAAADDGIRAVLLAAASAPARTWPAAARSMPPRPKPPISGPTWTASSTR